MPFDVGVHTHLDDAQSVIPAQIRAMATEVKLGRYEGRAWSLMQPPERLVENHRFKIKDRSRTALSGLIGDGVGGGWNSTDTTSLAMIAATVAVLNVGDVLEVESEQVVVKAVNASTIDVDQRGHGGTTAATHADQVAFTVIGQAINDTDASKVIAKAEQTGEYENYTQIIFEPIEQTFTDRIQAREAFAQNPTLIREALDRVSRKLYRSCILGRKQLGTNSIKQTSAGILHQLSDGGGQRTALRHNANGPLTEDKLKAALDSVWAQGGRPDTILLNPTNKKLFDPLTEGFIRMTRQEATRAGTDSVTEYEYQGEVLLFVEDVDMPTSRVAILTAPQLKRGWRKDDILRGPIEEPLNSSRELRFSLQGAVLFEVYGVGVDHIDIYGIV